MEDLPEKDILYTLHEKVSGILDEFQSEDEFSILNSISDNIRKLLEVNRAEERIESAQRIAEKFEEYMKNIDKLNMMINEFKGVVSMSRAALQDRKSISDEFTKNLDVFKSEIKMITDPFIGTQMIISKKLKSILEKMTEIESKIDKA